MPKQKELNEIPVNSSKQEEKTTNKSSNEEAEINIPYEELKQQLLEEKKRSKSYEDKLKMALADFQNLKRKIQSDIENELNDRFDKFMLDFLEIYDDFIRAKTAFEKSNVDTSGLDSIMKNIDSLLKKYHVEPIQALGEIFDPRYHEAISFTHDPALDDNTITKELRKGYISHDRVIRPTLVEISKKSE